MLSSYCNAYWMTLEDTNISPINPDVSDEVILLATGTMDRIYSSSYNVITQRNSFIEVDFYFIMDQNIISVDFPWEETQSLGYLNVLPRNSC